MPDTKSKSQNFLNKFLGRDGKGSLRQRVSNNEKKISLLKNIVKAPKAISQGFRDLGKSPIEPLEDIHESLDELLAVIRQDAKLEDKKAQQERLKKEQAARDAKEDKLENTKWEGIKKVGTKIVKPFQGLWDKMWNFLRNILLGNIVMKILDWIGDKKNQGKLENIFKFMKDWWPSLLAAYLLFGNSFGRLIVTLTAKVAMWTATIVGKLIPALSAALVKLKASKFARFLGGGKGKALLMTGGLMMATPGLINRFSDQDDEPEKKLATGGFVSGPSGTDRVPAKLTAGEFVMSTGAVEKFGVGTMEAINAAGGGTNRPTGGRYQGGGLVEKFKLEYPNLSTDQIQEEIDEQQRRMNRARSLRKESTSHPLFSAPKVTPRSLEERVADALSVDYGPSTSSVDIDFSSIQGLKGGGVKPAAKNQWWDFMDLFPNESTTKTPPVKPVTEKPVPGPPVQEANSTVQLYKQEKKRQMLAAQDAGTKIPDFDALVYLSKDKIKVLGITL